ncbi:hypothetical protein KEM56_007131, partial [Ascosphaera pollenicola]
MMNAAICRARAARAAQSLRLGGIRRRWMGTGTSATWHRHARERSHQVLSTLLIDGSKETDKEDVMKILKTDFQLNDSEMSRHNAAFIFMTPLLARWASSDLSFMEDVIHSIFTSQSSGQPEGHKYSIAAVVDKIPSIDGDFGNKHEGLSVCLTNLENIKLRPGSTSATIGRIKSVTVDEEPLVSIAIRRNVAAGQGSRMLQQQIGIRLANTLFVNGMPHTLLASQWLFQGNEKPKILDEIALSNCRILATQDASTLKSHLALMPVTAPRTVAGCVGNILSKLHRTGSETIAEPASLELERIFPEYLEQHGLKSANVGVWALVRPREMETSLDMDTSLESGARLFRVMSGGGGWGNKQGLLSLDPECDLSSKSFYDDSSMGLDVAFSTHEAQEQDLPPLPSFFGDKGFPSLGNTVSEGQTVQFFVGKLDDESLTVPDDTTASATSLPRMMFGVAPKNNDFGEQPSQAEKTDTNCSIT